MAKSLQEQLLGAGLVDNKKAKSIQKDKRIKRKQTGKGQVQKEKLQQVQRVEEQKRVKLDKDRELDRIKKLASDKISVRAQVKQLIQSNKVERQPGEVGFQFSVGKKIKKIYIGEEQQRHLSKGLLAIALFNDEYIFISHAVAEKIIQREASSIVYIKSKSDSDFNDNEQSEIDPYEDYKIPDDLMW